MKQLIIFLIILAFMAVPAFGDVIFGGHLGVNIKEIKDPGASLSLGTQEKLGDNDYLRFIYQSVNFGNENYDNIAAMEVHYFGVSERWDLGSRISMDYRPDNSEIGGAIGFEFMRKQFIAKTSVFVCFDAVKKGDLDPYFNFGIGLIFSLSQ